MVKENSPSQKPKSDSWITEFKNSDKTKPQATTPAQATYRLQLGAFESRERAEALRDALKADHPDVTITTANVSGKDFFRVRVGAYNTMDEALADLKKLMGAGYSEVAVVRTTQDEAFITLEKSE